MTKDEGGPVQKFLSNVVEKPEVFFTADESIVDQALQLTKYFYDTAKKHEVMEFSPFPELLTEGFDRDQIWEEIAAQNEPFLSYAQTTATEFAARKRKRSEMTDDEEEEEEPLLSGDDSSYVEEEEEFEGFGDEQQQQDMDEEEEEDNQEENDIAEEDAYEEEQEEEEEEASSHKRSEVDDDFFDLEKFNAWTEEQERRDMMSDPEDDDEEQIDYDNDLNAIADSDGEQEDLDDVADIKYADFFLPPKKSKRDTDKKPTKRVRFADDVKGGDDDDDDNVDMDMMSDEDMENDDDDEDVENEDGADDNEDEDDEYMESEDDADGNEGENDEEEQEDGENEESAPVRSLFDEDEEEQDEDVSAHQKRLERLKQQIEQFERENIQEKHWTLQGETSAKSRPVNSLLEEDLEFDHSVKPVPVITQEVTNALEELIKKRILDNNFDDVVRKSDPAAKPFQPSKIIELSDEKSKKSLAELYEEEYIKQKTNDQTNEKDEALKQEHKAISEMFDALCYKLDALSNFHFTPKPPKPEITIVSNAPAISMEEVLPVNVSDATLLAPEEVYDKKRGELKSKTEMTKSEKKRLRNKRKKQKKRAKQQQQQQQKATPVVTAKNKA